MKRLVFFRRDSMFRARSWLDNGKQRLSLHSGQVAHQAGAYLQFLLHEATRSISTPPWMECQSIAGLPPALSSPVPIYTPG